MEGTLHEQDGRYVLRFERRLDHPSEEVWQAITEPDRLRDWFPADIEGERVVGGKVRFVMRDDGGEGEITAFDPPRLFEYTWGDEVLRWDIQPVGEGCLLVFTNTLGDPTLASQNAAGWHACLHALESLLVGRPAAWSSVHDRVKDLEEDYAKSFS